MELYFYSYIIQAWGMENVTSWTPCIHGYELSLNLPLISNFLALTLPKHLWDLPLAMSDFLHLAETIYGAYLASDL